MWIWIALAWHIAVQLKSIEFFNEMGQSRAGEEEILYGSQSVKRDVLLLFFMFVDPSSDFRQHFVNDKL
jgi:hypothetical protein